jgi:hypothetical protein
MYLTPPQPPMFLHSVGSSTSGYHWEPSPVKSAYRIVGFAWFPVSDKPVSQDLARFMSDSGGATFTDQRNEVTVGRL